MLLRTRTVGNSRQENKRLNFHLLVTSPMFWSVHSNSPTQEMDLTGASPLACVTNVDTIRIHAK